MRLLNDTEVKYCIKILSNKSDNFDYTDIIKGDLHRAEVEVNKKDGEVSVRFNNFHNEFWQEARAPDFMTAEEYFPQEDYENVTKTLLTILNLIELLKKEGLILLFQSNGSSLLNRRFGPGKPDNKRIEFLRKYHDPVILSLGIEYIDKSIIATPEFHRFCEAGFVARDEQRFKKQIRIAVFSLVASFVLGLINTSINAHSKFCPSTTKNSTKQVDTLIGAIETLKISIDSLNYTSKKNTRILPIESIELKRGRFKKK